MAFLGGSISLRTFALGGKAPRPEHVLRALADRAFRADEIAGGTASGWVTRRDLFDVAFDEAAVLVDRHAVFGLRVDRRAVPASLLDAHVARAERAWRKEHSRDVVPRAVRLEIREEERRALLQTIPSTPSLQPVLWNLAEGRVHLGSLASTKAEVFARLFQESFRIAVEPLGPAERADRISVVRERVRSLAPLDFVRGGVQPVDGEATASFLGRDFLTWLLHRTERDGGDLLLDGWGRLGIFFEDRLAFEGEETACRLQVTAPGHPATSAEAKAALLLGKKLVRARLTLAADDEEIWKATLDADTLDLRSVRLPRAIETDPEARLVERLESIERVHDAVDALYRDFLRTRTDGSFLEREGPRLRDWVRSRRSDGDELFRA